MSASLLRRPAFLFSASALLIIAACVAVLRAHAFATNADVAAWGVTFDLTISIPLLYWWFVVRAGKARALTIAPVFLAGTALASFLIPSGQQQFLQQLGTIVVPLAEVLLVGALVRRILAARKERSTSSDPYERIHAAARTLAGEGRVAEVIASEVAMVYYAIFGWSAKAEERRGTAMTFHERSGWGSIVACILVLIAAEGIGMHLLLARWSPYAAWTWTAMDVWGALWLLGDYHALRLRRTFVDEDALHLRYGLRWNATIPHALIASTEEVRSESEWKRKDVLKVAMLDEPRWLITLREPVIAHGLAGLRKEIRGIALLADDEEWLSALRRGCPT